MLVDTNKILKKRNKTAFTKIGNSKHLKELEQEKEPWIVSTIYVLIVIWTRLVPGICFSQRL